LIAWKTDSPKASGKGGAPSPSISGLDLNISIFARIRKREGCTFSFDSKKIENAIYRAALDTLQDRSAARKISEGQSRECSKQKISDRTTQGVLEWVKGSLRTIPSFCQLGNL